MFTSLEQITQTHNVNFDANDLKYHEEILKIFNENLLDLQFSDVESEIYHNIGDYHQYTTKDYIEMEKYYLMGITLDDFDCMRKLGNYHYNTTNNYSKMEKYYLMGIDLEDVDCMRKLGNYHRSVTKNHSEMIKYYSMGINLENSSCMTCLGYYYYTEKNYKLMKKYYLMAIKFGNVEAMEGMGNYYRDVNKDENEMEKYYLMAFQAGNFESLETLAHYYREEEDYDKMTKFFLMGIEKYNDESFMTEYADYFLEIDKNYPMAKKYYLMAIEQSNSSYLSALTGYANYHRIYTKNYSEMMKYYSIAFKQNYQNFVGILKNDCDENILDLFKILSNLDMDDLALPIQDSCSKAVFCCDSCHKILPFEDLYNEAVYLQDFCRKAVLEELENLSTIEEIQEYINFDLKPINNNDKILYNLYHKYISENIQSPSGYITDFKINAIINENETKEYFVHSMVLKSEYFEILIDGDFKNQLSIDITVNTFQTIDDLLRYLYLKEINFNDMDIDRIRNLLKLADQFMFGELKKLCEIYSRYSKNIK
jgi:TPR repeat protein